MRIARVLAFRAEAVHLFVSSPGPRPVCGGNGESLTRPSTRGRCGSVVAEVDDVGVVLAISRVAGIGHTLRSGEIVVKNRCWQASAAPPQEARALQDTEPSHDPLGK